MFQKNVSLKSLSNYKIGGNAEYFFEANGIRGLVQAVIKARERKLPVFILGGGTNLLIDDAGFSGLVLKPNFNRIDIDDVELRVGAGVLIESVLDVTISKKLRGLEWAGGLPGTLGGAIRGNAGAFGGEIKDSIKEVVSLDISGAIPKIRRRNSKECDFGYRSSIFKSCGNKEIILEASLIFSLGDKNLIRASIEEKINYRKERHPMEYPNIGSIFKNVDVSAVSENVLKNIPLAAIKSDPFPVIPAAYLISKTGIKGVSFGGAMISPKHPNFIVNVLDAKSSHVESLITLAKEEVKNKFNIVLEEEVVRLRG